MAVFRSWSIRRRIFDHPNERSSHITPTPSGSGLVIAVTVLGVYIAASLIIPYEISWGIVSGASLIVIVSWFDDLFSVPITWRLLVHSAAAITVIVLHGFVSEVPLPYSEQSLKLGWVGSVITFCWILWLINSYNFMDGIDGLAGVQAITAGAGWLVVGLFLGTPSIYLLGGSLTITSIAFLFHNWPPARIFMGDAGSAFLGFMFASLPLMVDSETSLERGHYFVAGVFFVWLFVFDTLITLLRRVFRREKVWQAHREHLYQRLVLSGYTHRRVSVLYGIMTLITATASVLWLTNPHWFPTYIVLGLILIFSVFLLTLCWKRNCLFG